jgi:hypothetical protein
MILHLVLVGTQKQRVHPSEPYTAPIWVYTMVLISTCILCIQFLEGRIDNV